MACSEGLRGVPQQEQEKDGYLKETKQRERGPLVVSTKVILTFRVHYFTLIYSKLDFLLLD